MEHNYCDISPFREGELTDSSAEQSSSATTPSQIPVESFSNRFIYPSNLDASNTRNDIHGCMSEYAWIDHSGFDPTNTNRNSFASYDHSPSGIGKLEVDDGLDQIPHLTTLFEGIPSYPDHSHSLSSWVSNSQTVAGLLARRSAHAPSTPSRSTAPGQPSFVPFEGAAPLASLAPQHELAPSELEDSDDDPDVAMEDSDHEKDELLTTNSIAVQTLSECYCPFSRTTTWGRLYDSDGAEVPAKVFARFRSKSLDKSSASEPHYITYRRNYFSNEMWFELEPPTESADGKLYVEYEQVRYPVQSFGVRMRAVNTNEEGENVEISVFTPKRDRPISPTPALEQKMQPNMPKHSHVYNESTGFGSNKEFLPSFYTCVHNQFRQATKNNGSRRKQQSYYRIVVELRAFILGPSGGEVLVKIASTISGSLVVRGRCPGSFADDPNHQKTKPRRDSHRRRNYKAARPTKKRGQSNSSPQNTPKQVGNERTPCHTVSWAIPSSMTSLTSDSRSCASTTITPLSTNISPQQMSPRDEIRETLLSLPIRNELLLHAVPRSAGSFLIDDQRDEASEDGGLASNYELFDPMASEVEIPHKQILTPQLDQYGIDFTQRGYSCSHMSADFTRQNYYDASTTWEHINGPLGYAQ